MYSLVGRYIQTYIQTKTPGMQWTAKYGYIYLDAMHVDVAIDGMNEAGLSFQYLYLPAEASYQSLPQQDKQNILPYLQFGDWVLGSFKTIDEVKSALQSIVVVNQYVPGMGTRIFPLHASIYDASGRGLVVEFYDNKIVTFDSIGLMTNSPKYNWHVTNLSNYINLDAATPLPVRQGDTTFAALGQGSGAIGLPGDSSSPSRFVKISFLLKNITKVTNQQDLLNLCQHIINTVDIPEGTVKVDRTTNSPSEQTEWVVFKDITNHVFYWRTYNNLAIRAIHLDKINWNDPASRFKLSIENPAQSVNMDKIFKQTHSEN